jgi:hypothetical protein
MWNTLKNMWSSKPEDKYAKYKRTAKYTAHYLNRLQNPHSRSQRKYAYLDDSDSDRRRSHRRGHRHRGHSDSDRLNDAINRPLHSRDDDRIRRLKRELKLLDHQYSSASESEGNTADLQRIVGKLEKKFLMARQELAAELAKKAAKQNALMGQYGHYNMMPIMNAAMMQASLAAPGLAAFAPPTPAGLNAAALGAASYNIMNDPAATPHQVHMAQLQNEAARMKAGHEAAQVAVNHFDINAANDAATAQTFSASGKHFQNIGRGVIGAVAGPGNAILATAQAGKGWFTRFGQTVGLS